MSAPAEHLERGSVCLALYPFSLGFPLDAVRRDDTDDLLAQLDRFDDVAQIERTLHPGDAPEVVVRLKLRRVLLLQDATDPRQQDVVVSRITSVSDRTRQRAGFYRRLTAGEHPTALRIGDDRRHGTRGREAFVNLMNISRIRKSTILRRVGWLDRDELREVTDRLVTSLEMDLSHRATRAS